MCVHAIVLYCAIVLLYYIMLLCYCTIGFMITVPSSCDKIFEAFLRLDCVVERLADLIIYVIIFRIMLESSPEMMVEVLFLLMHQELRFRSRLQCKAWTRMKTTQVRLPHDSKYIYIMI